MSLCSFRSLSTWSILLQMGMFSSLLQYFVEQSNIFYDLIFFSDTYVYRKLYFVYFFFLG
jgi:predicted Zn-dependent peptidase